MLHFFRVAGNLLQGCSIASTSALIYERLDACVLLFTLCWVHRHVFPHAEAELGDGDHVVPVAALLLLPAAEVFVEIPTLFYGIKVEIQPETEYSRPLDLLSSVFANLSVFSADASEFLI